jgi:DNA invertase Pin-like site-specific DNA recombinase
MSTEQDTDSVDEAIRLSERLDEIRAVAKQVEAARDAAIRRAASEGVSRVQLAKSLGLARSRLYVVLNEPSEDDEDLYEWLANQEEAAHERWFANGQEGAPDDYWPSTL